MANAQVLTYNDKTKYFDSCKKSFAETLDIQTNCELPFVLGRLHVPENNRFRFPYFNANNWVDGTVVYNDKLFSVANLKYDIENDKVVYLLTSSNHLMYCVALDENFITEFSILGKTFRYFRNLSDVKGRNIDSGYFEVVYDGDITFLVRTTKEKVFDSEWPHFNYKQSVTMYVGEGGKYSQIKNMTEFRKQLGDKKTEISSFVRKNHLKLKTSDYSSVPKILSYYESISKPKE